jgi:glutathione peroxidase-family protein
VIIGFSNNFGSQEPGTNEEIAFANKIMVLLPMMDKVSVKGGDMRNVQFLTKKSKMD